MPVNENVYNLPMVGGSTFGRYPKISNAYTYNMIVADQALVPFAGYKKALTLRGEGEGRNLYVSTKSNQMFVIISNEVYIVSPDNSYALLGNLRTSSGPVAISENDANQVAIADGEKIYVYNTSMPSGLVEVNVDFSPTYITFLDGYLIAPDGDTNQWRLSELNNALSWPSPSGPITDASFTGELQSEPDVCQVTIAFKRQLFVIGKTITELWYDVGNTTFPFQRDNIVAINYGIISIDTIVSEFNMLVWLGTNSKGNLAIVASFGGNAQIIATDGIEFFLSKLTRPEDCSAFLFQEDGHTFYQIVWRTDNVSLVYDFNSGLFCHVTDENWNHHIARRAAFFNNKNYFISFEDGNIYEFGNKYTTYNGLYIPRMRIIPSFRLPNTDRFSVPLVELTMENGMSQITQNIDLSVSKDGGYTYINAERKILNPLGKRQNKVRFYSHGMANEISFKFIFLGSPIGNNDNNLVIVDERDPNNTQRFVILGATMNWY